MQEPASSGHGQTILVIYDMQGDEMKVAVPGTPERPADFSLKPQVRIYSFKRD